MTLSQIQCFLSNKDHQDELLLDYASYFCKSNKTMFAHNDKALLSKS